VLGAAPLSLFLTYMMAIRAINKVNRPKAEESQSGNLKEEETSE